MSDGIEALLESYECRSVASGSQGRIIIANGLIVEFDSLDDRPKARLERAMQLWCEGQRLTPEMFNSNEGRTTMHKQLVGAFKTHKVRLYGFIKSIVGQKSFVISDIDSAKKQNKANPVVLKRAKQRVDDLYARMIK